MGFSTAKRLVPVLLDACPTKVIQAFYHKTWQYMDAYRFMHYVYQFITVTHSGCSYRLGLNAKEAEYAVKKYCSHCKVEASITMDMVILNNPE